MIFNTIALSFASTPAELGTSSLSWGSSTSSNVSTVGAWGSSTGLVSVGQLVYGNVVNINTNDTLVWKSATGSQQNLTLTHSPMMVMDATPDNFKWGSFAPFNQDRTTTWGNFTKHQMSTTFKYGSYNTLVQNTSPDWGTVSKLQIVQPLKWGWDDRILTIKNFSSTYAQEKAWITYSIPRYLILLPSATLTKLSGSVDIPIANIQISSSSDSWIWSWTAEVVGKSNLALITPVSGTPVDVDININGFIWRAYVEEVNEAHNQATRTYTISGRSRTANLGSDYSGIHSKVNTSPYLASQLADQEVTGLGYTINWAINDWTVPAGSFSYEGKSAIEAVAQIANSVGAVMIPTLTTDVVKIANFMRVDPRDLATTVPDHSYDDSVLYTANMKYRKETLYDRVWVHGTDANAVMVRGTLSGHAGTNPAPLMSNQLIVDQVAGRIAASNYLYKGGRWVDLSITAPVDTGSVDLMQVGDIAEITINSVVYKGYVRSVSIGVSGGLALDVVQNVNIECWLGE